MRRTSKGVSAAAESTSIDYDAHWKDIIKTFFYPMLQSLLPELAEVMDRSRDIDYLEQELNAVTLAIDGPKQQADVLVKVPIKSGGDIWLALHIEVQGKDGEDLPERMFFYNSMLRLKYRKKKKTKDQGKNNAQTGRITDVISLAILTARRPRGESGFFERKSYRNELLYKYPTIKLWRLDEKVLAGSENPFDWALLSGLHVIKSGQKDKSRLTYLKTLSDMLDSKGWNTGDKVLLYRFMEAILKPKGLELQREYRAWISEKHKEGEKMYISVAEEIGMERGIKKGIKKGIKRGLERGVAKGAEQTAYRMLERGMDISLISELSDLPEERVRQLAEERLRAGTKS